MGTEISFSRRQAHQWGDSTVLSHHTPHRALYYAWERRCVQPRLTLYRMNLTSRSSRRTSLQISLACTATSITDEPGTAFRPVCFARTISCHGEKATLGSTRRSVCRAMSLSGKCLRVASSFSGGVLALEIMWERATNITTLPSGALSPSGSQHRQHTQLLNNCRTCRRFPPLAPLSCRITSKIHAFMFT